MRNIFIIITLFIAALSEAATYYLSPGGNDSDPGTLAQPWKTIAKLRTGLTDGDTAIFRGGYYTNAEFYSTDTHINITFQAYPGEIPIITGYKHPIDPDSNAAFLWLASWTNFVMDGLLVVSNRFNMSCRYMRNSTFKNCVFGYGDTNDSGLGITYGSVQIRNCSYLTFTNCEFRDWGDFLHHNDDYGTTIQVGGGNDTYSSNDIGHVFVNCKFVHGGHANVELFSSNHVFRGCFFYNPAFFLKTNGVYYGNRNIGALGLYNARNLFENCTFAAAGRPCDDNETAGLELSSPYHIVRNNVFHNQAGPGLSVYSKGTGLGPSNIYFYNNSFSRIALNDWPAGGLVANDLYAARSTGLDSVSNRWVNNVYSFIGESNTSGVYLFFSTSNKQYRFASNYENTGDPLYANTNWGGINDFYNPDLHLQRGSPCIDAGSWLAFITSASGSGTSFVVDDAGYFYDGWGIPGEVGDLIQLQGQTVQTRITSVNYDTLTLTVSNPLTWTNGQGVSLPYKGIAPDMGAYETDPVHVTILGKAKFLGKATIR